MVEFRWTEISFLLVPVLQVTAAATGQFLLYLTVRVGDEVTLPCGNVIAGQQQCDSTTWIFAGSGSKAAVELIQLGQIGKNARAKSNRLSVTEKCSLVIKKVTVEDAGDYTCRQYNKSGQQQGPGSAVTLSVVTMTEDEVTLTCSVSTREQCRHTVKWLYEGNQDIKQSQSTCSASVTFTTSPVVYTSKNYELLACEVTDNRTGEVSTFSRQSSGKNTGWWPYVAGAAGLAALLIVVVAVIRWRRTKANTAQMGDNIGLTSTPEVTQSAPKTSQDTADPEDGVSYTSISYTRKTNRKAWVRGGEDAVTYSTVKAPSSSAGASADPSDLYATIT